MTDLVVTTFDWVPKSPRGHLRDLRVRWALEEAGLPYRVESVPFEDRNAAHLAHQPFGQVPWLRDGDISLFESGAILLHLGERSGALMPTDAAGRAAALEWTIAALNSVEMAVMPWMIFQFARDDSATPGKRKLDDFLTARLGRLEAVVATRPWLAGRFSIADILMADILRILDGGERLADHPRCKEYMNRAIARPAFVQALADQMAHFAAADARRAKVPE